MRIKLKFIDEASFPIRFEAGVDPTPITPYEGEYEVIPSRETQVLETAGLMMTAPVIVNPIPRNYGLITYNGFEILVS